MTKTTGQEPLRARRAGHPGTPGRVSGEEPRTPWHLALAALLLLVLAIPAALLVAPGFIGPEAPPPAPAPPAWQQAPATIAAPQVLAPLQQSAPVPAQSAVSAQLEPVLKTDGGGTFTGMV